MTFNKSNKTSKEQLSKLENFVLYEIDGEPSQNENVIDCVIRLLKDYEEELKELETELELQKQ